jgi:hypothetical protein
MAPQPWEAYVLVAALGGLVGLAEILSTFSSTPLLALRTLWAWLLVALNAGTAVLALWIVFHLLPDTSDPLLIALAVGLGFPALIRTNFTLARRLGSEAGVGEGQALSINLGWLYEQFQNFVRTQIDLALVLQRQALLRPLVEKYPNLEELVSIAHNLIQERALFSREEIGQMQKYVEDVQEDEKLAESVKRVTLARFILDVGGPGYVKELIRGR